jgi:anti-sigma factor RsiW
VTTCERLESLIVERAAGTLAPEDGTELDLHLAACPACRAELQSYGEALDLARIPAPAGEAPSLAPGTLAAWRRRRRRRLFGLALGSGLAAAAAAALVMLAPAVLGHRHAAGPDEVAAWEPDVDSALAVSGITGTTGTTTSTASTTSSAAVDDDELTAADYALASFDGE